MHAGQHQRVPAGAGQLPLGPAEARFGPSTALCVRAAPRQEAQQNPAPAATDDSAHRSPALLCMLKGSCSPAGGVEDPSFIGVKDLEMLLAH